MHLVLFVLCVDNSGDDASTPHPSIIAALGSTTVGLFGWIFLGLLILALFAVIGMAIYIIKGCCQKKRYSLEPGPVVALMIAYTDLLC